MSVFRRGTKWMYEIMVEGQRHTKGGFDKKSEASEAESDLRKQLKLRRGDMDLLTLMTLRTEYLEKHKTDRYFEENKRILKEFYVFTGNQMCSAVTKKQVKEYIDQFFSTPHMANYKLRVVAAMFNHGIKEEWITNNPARGIGLVKCDKKKKYIPPVGDFEKVLRVAKRHQRDFLIVLRNTLARHSEISSLKWEDVDLESQSVTLWTRKKARGELTPRIIPMTKELHETLTSMKEDWEHAGKPSPHVFVNPDTGEQYHRWHKMLKWLCKKAGVSYFSHHAIRHLGASTLAKRGVPITDIQAILGHESVTTTAIYLQSLIGSTTESIHRLHE